jgi:hypothetical protein
MKVLVIILFDIVYEVLRVLKGETSLTQLGDFIMEV